MVILKEQRLPVPKLRFLADSQQLMQNSAFKCLASWMPENAALVESEQK